MILNNSQVYHVNRWGTTKIIEFSDDYPVSDISYARPDKSVEWLKKKTDAAKKLGVNSVTISGMTEILASHYGNNSITVEDAVKMYRDCFEELKNEGLEINAAAPNAFLWKYTDRYLNAPVFTTQYIIETDTVPFLQLVLSGNTELYAPYSNFSFYGDKDILRLIDYNTYPSFVITNEPAHVLGSTNSSNFYSTEYKLYKDIIINVYNKVSATLNMIAGKEWVNREVAENGVVINTYSDNTKVIINYTDNFVTYF